MSFSSSTISIGSPTQKADYDRLMNNTIYLKSEAAIFTGAKTFQSSVVCNSEFNIKVGGVVYTVSSSTVEGYLVVT